MKPLLISITFLAVLFPVLAQTNGLPTIPGVPETPLEWTYLAIVCITPLVIAGLKWLVPKIPKVALPFVAPVVGVILDQIAAFATAHESNLVLGLISGALGVWLREGVDQVKKLGKPEQQ